MKTKEWESWNWDYNDAFREVTFNVLGKEFIALVRVKPDKRTWIMLYQNEDNINDWFIREEVVSPDIWHYGKSILPQTYNRLLSILMDKA